MTKKDYEAIAEIIKSSEDIAQADYSAFDRSYEYGNGFTGGFDSAIYSISQGLIKVFEADNPRFEKKIFLKACGL